MSNTSTENILGYEVTGKNKVGCIEIIQHWLNENDGPYYFVCANPHSIQVAQNDEDFKNALENADLITPDGVGIVLASRILHGNIKERITGSDIFWGLSESLNEIQIGRYFFLGSTEDVLTLMKKKMALEFPGIEVVGTYSPPFKSDFSDDDNMKMIDEINAAKPDILWVGMTAPKQEKWIYKNKEKLNVKFIGAIGAVFDFYAGTVKRSHPVFQRMGLEWLPRLLQEPRRLWRRNFISNPMFMIRILRQRIGH